MAIETVSESEITHSAMLKRLLAYWLSKKNGLKIPSRSDIDPLELPFALGNIAVVAVLSEMADYRFTLYGTNLTDRFGKDLTGKSPRDHEDTLFANMMIDTYDETVRSRTPQFYVRDMIGATGRLLCYAVLILPLRSVDGAVTKLLVAVDFDYHSSRQRQHIA